MARFVEGFFLCSGIVTLEKDGYWWQEVPTKNLAIISAAKEEEEEQERREKLRREMKETHEGVDYLCMWKPLMLWTCTSILHITAQIIIILVTSPSYPRPNFAANHPFSSSFYLCLSQCCIRYQSIRLYLGFVFMCFGPFLYFYPNMMPLPNPSVTISS